MRQLPNALCGGGLSSACKNSEVRPASPLLCETRPGACASSYSPSDQVCKSVWGDKLSWMGDLRQRTERSRRVSRGHYRRAANRCLCFSWHLAGHGALNLLSRRRCNFEQDLDNLDSKCGHAIAWPSPRLASVPMCSLPPQSTSDRRSTHPTQERERPHGLSPLPQGHERATGLQTS